MSFNLTQSDSNLFEGELAQYEVPVLNVTRDLPVEYMILLFGFITPIFFVITVVANIIIVVVLSRPDMRTPTNQVLLAMAVADLLTLVFPVPWYFYMYTLGNYRNLLYPSLLCNLYNYMNEILPAFFHTASIWCTILLACQRFIYICHPSTARIWCTNKRVTKIIFLIFLAAFLHQSTRFFDSHYENVLLLGGNNDVNLLNASSSSSTVTIKNAKPRRACQSIMSTWMKSIEDLYFVSYFLFRIIFVHIGPCIILVIFNFLLYSALKKAEKTRAKLFLKHNTIDGNCVNSHGSYGSASCVSGSDKIIQIENASRTSICVEVRKINRGLKRSSGRDANSTTFMLIVVVTVFLIVEIPLAITTAVHVTENVFELELVSDRFLNMTIIFTNFFIIISYPLNFAIYCGMSRAFRETFQQIFIRRIVTSSNNNNSANTSPATNKTTKGTESERIYSRSNVKNEQPTIDITSEQSNSSARCVTINGSKQTNSNQVNPCEPDGNPASDNNDKTDEVVGVEMMKGSIGNASINSPPPPPPSIVKQLAITDRNGITQLVDPIDGLNNINSNNNITSNSKPRPNGLHETML